MKNSNLPTSNLVVRRSALIKAILASSIAASMIGLVWAQDLYEQGQRQLDSHDYRAAQETFTQIANTKGNNQDAALYWLAYAQFKNGLGKLALGTISQLHHDHPESRWLDDAKALKVEIQDKHGEPIDIDDEEMKLYALNSLMNAPSERSIDILQKMLNSNSSEQIKHRALFVLSQIQDPRAFDTIASAAKDSSNTSLQLQAIQLLGITASDHSLDLLDEIYKSTDNEEIKSAIMHSCMLAGRTDNLVRLARTENTPALKSQAIHLIGATSNSEVLLNMYRDTNFANYRKDLIQGIAITGDANALMQIIDSEKDEEYIAEAIMRLGITGPQDSAQGLAELYQKYTSHAIREAVIQAMFIQQNTAELISIVKTETDTELKRSALQKLSIMQSDEAHEYFNSILDID